VLSLCEDWAVVSSKQICGNLLLQCREAYTDRDMLARFFGGGTPEAPDGASPKEKEDNGGNGPVETAQKDQAVTTRISKMDSIIRYTSLPVFSFATHPALSSNV